MPLPKKSIRMCSGCENNFYNGHNDYGVKECWSFDNAEVVETLDVPINQCPPYDEHQLSCHLSCYRRRGIVSLKNFGKIKQGPYAGQYCCGSDVNYWERKISKND